MPVAAPRPCSHTGCRALATAGGRCADHQREVWRKKPVATKRITGRRLQAMRAQLFAANPLCVVCAKLDLVTLATQRDHIKPLSEGGTDEADNVQGLCDACHDEKSLGESLKARFSA